MKKKMSNKVFLTIWTVILAIVLLLAIALPVLVNIFYLQIVGYFHLPQDTTTVTPLEGTENWDSQYYGEGLSKEDAVAYGQEVAEKITDEGIILLKNTDNALPLSERNVTMLGRRSVDPAYGGNGAGKVNGEVVSPYDALTEEGFTVNKEAYDFFNKNYAAYLEESEPNACGATTPASYVCEIPADTYSFTPASGDTALVFIGRTGSEGADHLVDYKGYSDTEGVQYQNKNDHVKAEAANIQQGQHILELTAEEKSMVAFAEANYSKVVVVVNSTNVMELGELENDDKINAIIWGGLPGAVGMKSLAKVLDGTVNPSGHTTDTFPTDLTADPSFVNFGDFTYSDGTTKFVDYAEGIYVGYRYYETAAVESEQGNYPDFDYDSAVVYPFGYGLSYTSFTQEMTSCKQDGDNVVVNVKVTNTGDVAGRDAVEVYYTAPYTKGGIEKAAVNLAAYAKTSELAPGASEEVELSFPVEQMASYDYKTEKAYVLEAGDYVISLREDAHTVIAEQNISVANTIVYSGDNKRESDEVTATNQFDEVSAMFTDDATESGKVLNMSRADFAGTFPKAPDDTLKDITREFNGAPLADAAGLQEFDVNATINDSDTTVLEAQNGMSLIDLRGKSYDDEAWNELLDQLTFADLQTLAFSGYGTSEMLSIGMPQTFHNDGSAGWGTTVDGACAYCAAPALAYTWNKDLAYEFGKAIALEGRAYNMSGWYAPGANIHRSAFGGRNYEYYSEDPLLTGKVSADVISGLVDNGVFPFMKHFALNDQETNRSGVCTWANEQAIREIYLRPFEIAIKEATATIRYYADDSDVMTETEIPAMLGIMTSYNRIGTTLSPYSSNLLLNVSREEWGYNGVYLTDLGAGEINPYLNAGGNAVLLISCGEESPLNNSATYTNLAKEAVHHFAYAIVNSCAMNGLVPGAVISYTPAAWKIAVWGLSAVLGIFFVAGLVWVVIRVRKNKNTTKQA